MTDYQMGALEAKFADVIWENEPVTSSELAKRGEELFGWKKSTTYTVLKRLCEKNIFQNNKGTVTSVISRDEFCSAKSEMFVKESFNGSLPAFIAAFSKRNALSAEDVAELRRMVEEYGEE